MYMEIGRHRCLIANDHIRIGSNSYEKVKTFKYFGSLVVLRMQYNVDLKQKIHPIIQSKHFCILHFSLRF